MGEILNFIITKCHGQVPESELKALESAYQETEHYISRGQCYRCGKVFNTNYLMPEQIWSINQQAGYPSNIDGSMVSIEICDTCMMQFLSKKITFDKRKFKGIY